MQHCAEGISCAALMKWAERTSPRGWSLSESQVLLQPYSEALGGCCDRASPFPSPSLTPRGVDHHRGVPCWCDETGGRGSARLHPQLQLQGGRDCHHWHSHLGDCVQPGQPHLPHGEPGRVGNAFALLTPGLLGKFYPRTIMGMGASRGGHGW